MLHGAVLRLYLHSKQFMGRPHGDCCCRQVHGMVSQIDPTLVKVCNEIAAKGGPTQLPGVPRGVLVPVVAPPAVRASARLRGFQPEVDALKTSEGSARRTRRSSEGLLPGMIDLKSILAALFKQ